MNGKSPQPYSTLGNHLRFLREQSKESMADVSGAVEIDERTYERIEAGHERPAEDILMLLISHFNMQDQEAVQLWELAGYEGDVPEHARPEDILANDQHKPIVILMGIDGRTMYTDAADVQANQTGITIAFGQQGSGKQAMPVAKLGMSHEQAQAVLYSLQRALLDAKYMNGPKQLPPSSSASDNVR